MTHDIKPGAGLASLHATGSHVALPTAMRVARIEQDNYRTKTLVLDGTLDAYPGQFVMVWLPRFDEKPYSLVNADPVTLMVTSVGPMSGLLHELAEGDLLWIRGPFGRGFSVGKQQRLLFVGGGYGVAPLLWLARTSRGHVSAVDVVIGARTAQDVLYTNRFETLGQTHSASGGSLRVQVTTEDGSAGVHGRVTTVVEPMLAAGQVDGIFACGPHGMLGALESLGKRYGVTCQLSWEAYMRCGIGICGSCDHHGKLLCLDGPVLTTDYVASTADDAGLHSA